MTPIIATALGMVLLVVGAERVVKDGTALASRFGVSPMVVGVTVVSVGTSLPELAVGISAVRNGDAELAIGNIVGTNLVNILFILGLAAVLSPLVFERRVLRFDLPAVVGASALLYVLAWDGELGVGDGVWLLAYAAVYLGLVVRNARAESRGDDGPGDDDSPTGPEEASTSAGSSTAWTATTLLVAMVVLVVGSEVLVGGATSLARDLGASDALIGLTVVAIGTSAPELVTTVVSTFRGGRDLALGNVLGSSVLNIALILGITLAVSPSPSAVPAEILYGDLALMAATALLCVPVFLTGRRVSRPEGVLFMGTYLAYLGWLLATRL